VRSPHGGRVGGGEFGLVRSLLDGGFRSPFAVATRYLVTSRPVLRPPHVRPTSALGSILSGSGSAGPDSKFWPTAGVHCRHGTPAPSNEPPRDLDFSRRGTGVLPDGLFSHGKHAHGW
jgi:hypothetical protein